MDSLHETQTKSIKTYCKLCYTEYTITEDCIFSGSDPNTYYARCPICGFGKPIPFSEVEKVFGKLKV